MAIQTITYSDKQAMGLQPSIPSENKVMDTDMNEIKSVVNNNATILSNVGDKYEYTLTRTTATVATLAWHNLATNKTTDVIPTGRYLIIFRGEVSGTVSTTNVCTIQPSIDGGVSVSQRLSIPTNNYGSAFQVWRIVDFNTATTHTINIQGWSNSQFTVSRDAVATFIRLK